MFKKKLNLKLSLWTSWTNNIWQLIQGGGRGIVQNFNGQFIQKTMPVFFCHVIMWLCSCQKTFWFFVCAWFPR